MDLNQVKELIPLDKQNALYYFCSSSTLQALTMYTFLVCACFWFLSFWSVRGTEAEHCRWPHPVHEVHWPAAAADGRGEALQ